MDAVKYIKEKQRMCTSYEECMDCGLHEGEMEKSMGCYTYCTEYPEEAVSIIEKWSQEHPQKTMLSDFLEKYPKARLRDNGTPRDVCPYSLGYEEHKGCCDGRCMKCWNRPLEE